MKFRAGDVQEKCYNIYVELTGAIWGHISKIPAEFTKEITRQWRNENRDRMRKKILIIIAGK